MGGHPWDQAKVSVHDRWPLIRGPGGGGGTPNTLQHHYASPPEIYIVVTCTDVLCMVSKINEITMFSTVYTHTFIHSTISAYNVHGNRGMC